MGRPIGSTVERPSYRRHKASGQAVVTLAGVDHYLGKYNTAESKAEYRRLLAEWMVSGQVTSTDAGIAIVEVANAFWQHAKAFYGGGTHQGELGSYRLAVKLLKDLYGHTPAKDFGPKALTAVRQSMVEAGWCRNYCNRQTGRIKHIFKWAVSRELVDVTVYQALLTVEGLKKGKSNARESAKVKPVAEEKVLAILPHVTSTVKAMLELQMATGMRPGELCIMRGCDIVRGDGMWAYRPAYHKTQHHDHDRVVFLGPKAQAAITPLLKDDPQAYIFSPAKSEAERRGKVHELRVESGTPLSCGNRPGTNRKAKPRKAPSDHYTTDSYRRAIQYACVKVFKMPADLRNAKDDTPEVRMEKAQKRARWRRENVFHPHQIRHNVGTKVRKDFGVEAAQVVLGHSNIDMTEVYAERNEEAAKAVMSQVG